MKSLRKSLGKDSVRPQISTPLPQVSKPPSALLPPSKVIRALAPHRAEAAQELSFQKGDFFYVIRDEGAGARWYEAHNPITGARGLVPREKFEELSKKATSTPSSGMSPPQQSSTPPSIVNSGPRKRTAAFYAVVMHDFVAERPDELDAKRGDAITVVAQSNREWLVAKPIDRVGKPGLIPVTFVELKDPATGNPITDVEGLMDRGELPKVEDWKRSITEYKQNSISLGVISTAELLNGSVPKSHTPQAQSIDQSQHQSQPSSHEPDYLNSQPAAEQTARTPPPPEPLPEGVLISADVVSFHHEMDDFWFRLDAMFQPYPLSGQDQLPNARRLVLFRVYNDFYDFQVALLNQFPKEAGREPPHARILPYMPGPADHVDHQLTETRREELNVYLHQLCDLNTTGYKYILDDFVVRMFLAPKPGDVETETPPMDEELDRIMQEDAARRADSSDGYIDPLGSPDEYDELRDKVGRMSLGRGSDVSDYEDEGYATSSHPQRSIDRSSYEHYDRRPNTDSLRQQALTYNHQRTGSTSSFQQRAGSPYTSYSRSGSPLPERGSSPYAHSSAARDDPPHASEQSGWSESHRRPAPSTASSSSFHSSNPSIGGRSRSHSTANINTPPISAANSQTAFVKIKIFDRVSDDMIAIRVHPNVSHTELMDKVQSRLGEVSNLKYPDNTRGDLVVIADDRELRSWMDNTEKHLLYAD